jgi:diguanylate cyclase (GGDEF)-like protein
VFSAAPVVDSNNSLPPKGIILTARFIDGMLLEQLKNQTSIDFEITNIPKKSLTETELIALDAMNAKKNYYVSEIKDEYFQVYTYIPDYNKSPLLLIKAKVERQFVNASLKIFILAYIMIFFLGLIILVSIFITLGKKIILPLANFTNHVITIAESEDLALRLEVKGKDEINTLSYEFNRMLEQISLIKQRDEKILFEQSYKDFLTDTDNRRSFDDRITKEWNRCKREMQPLSLVMLDVDFFKLFNDHYGHQEGDYCLIRITAALKEALKRSGDFVARYGGEEFSVLLPNTDLEQAKIIAEKLRNNIEELKIPHAKSKYKIITMTLGINSLIPDDNITIKEFIEKADKALYRGKASGRNKVIS